MTKSKGEAIYPDGGLEVDVSLEITSIDPVIGSLGGGNTLTVQGTGFSQSTEVTINGNSCMISSISSSEIICITPPSTTEATYNLTVTDNK